MKLFGPIVTSIHEDLDFSLPSPNQTGVTTHRHRYPRNLKKVGGKQVENSPLETTGVF